jgi:signal recognition particle receptor subunit alpha
MRGGMGRMRRGSPRMLSHMVSPAELIGLTNAAHPRSLLLLAKENGFDVVLIDTAGRMQDNEPLMRALAKLITVNNPDKIVFVGEALVGNEAVDQLSKFDRSLKDFSSAGSGAKAKARGIDGMILTKFDTIVS